MRCAFLSMAAAVLVFGLATPGQARTCKPVAYGVYSTSVRTDGKAPGGAQVTEAEGKQRAIAAWRTYVRKKIGLTYAVWSNAQAPMATCRLIRASVSSGGATTLNCRARALPCSAF